MDLVVFVLVCRVNPCTNGFFTHGNHCRVRKTPQSYIGLDEVVVYQPIKLNSFEEMKKYMLLRRRVLKVYPYAQLASERFTTLKERLDHMMDVAKKSAMPKGLKSIWRESFQKN